MALFLTMSPTAVRTARRTLVQRIDRFADRGSAARLLRRWSGRWGRPTAARIGSLCNLYTWKMTAEEMRALKLHFQVHRHYLDGMRK
jgi:hypothetical protein